MRERLRSWWQKIQQHPYATGMVVVLVLMLFIFLAYRFGWDWTGFNSGISQITITNTSKGNYTATITQSAKSLWDWLGLLATLAIPAVVGLGAAWITTKQAQVSDAENKDNQRETRLQDYFDKISELVLKQNLLQSKHGDPVRIMARARTLSVLHELDADRKRSILLYLTESYLIKASTGGIRILGITAPNVPDQIILLYDADLSRANLSKAPLWGIDLTGADLSEANLSEVNLSIPSGLTILLGHQGSILDRADLSGVNLRKANLNHVSLTNAVLKGANLSEADLSESNLKGAIVTQEQLNSAKSLQGATMPDGTIHP